MPHVDRPTWMTLRQCSTSLYNICNEVQRQKQEQIRVHVLIYKYWPHHARLWMLVEKVAEEMEIDDPLMKHLNPVRTRDCYHIVEMSLYEFMKRMGNFAAIIPRRKKR